MASNYGIFNRGGIIFGVLSMLFAMGMFYRVSPAVIAPNLIADFSLNAGTLGFLGGGFFYAFAFMQMPMGPLLDRVGPRIIISCFALIAAAGAFLFALAPSYHVALLARILMGIGMASMLMGALKVFLLAFPAGSFSTLSGLVISVGMIGSTFAASPLAYLTSQMGWRAVFFITGAVTAVLGFLSLFILKGLASSKNPMGVPSTESPMSLIQSARLIMGSLSFWQISTAAFFRYGTFASIQGLWLGLYLMDIKQLSPVDAGHILIMLSLGNIAGAPVAGWLSDRSSHGTKVVTMAGMSLYCLSLFSLTGFWQINGTGLFMLISFCIGFFHAFGTMLYSHAKDLFPLSIAGTAMTGVNFFFMLGGAVMMTVFGKFIELFPRMGRSYSSEAYEFCFIICFLSMTVSLCFYAFSKKGRHGKAALQRSKTKIS